MAHIIDLLPLAQADMRHVYSQIERFVSRESAEKWFSGIMSEIRSLDFMPESCPLADEAADLGFELRMALFGRRRHVYRILFEIVGESIKVHRVRHAAQDVLTEDDI